MDIVYDLTSEFCGFFSNYFFLLYVYIICRENELILNIYDNKWRFKYKDGFIDYFDIKNIKNIKIMNKMINTEYVYRHMNIPAIRYPLSIYKKYVLDLYKLNEKVIRKYKEYINLIRLPDEYNSIFIRCGDKLIHESKYYDVNNYMDYLIKLNSKTKNLFIHSDDHREVLKCINYNEQKNLGFNIYYITNEYEKGALVIEHLRYETEHKFENIKSINQMDSFEIKDHTEKMLIAIEILKKSSAVVTDYQSNVSRFLKLYCEGDVYSILNDEPDMDTDEYKNPSYGFIK
jgi:hypothetical protein